MSSVGPERRPLAEFADELGVVVPCAGNLPLDMSDPESTWFIERGAVDVFVVEHRDGEEQSAPQHLLRAAAGRLLPGTPPHSGDTTLSLVAKGVQGTLLRRLPSARLAAVRTTELAEQVDAWVTDVSAMLTRDVMHRPRPDALVESGSEVRTASGAVSVRRGVVWMSAPPGTGLFLSLMDPAIGGAGRRGGETIPLTPDSWFTLAEEAPISVRSAGALAEEGLLWPMLANFHAVAFALERLNRSLAVVDEANLERVRATNRRTDEEVARRQLFDLYGLASETEAAARESELVEALRAIGRREGIPFRFPSGGEGSDAGDRLAQILDASGVRRRRVRLAREDQWWLGDSGALLAFRGDRPVALLPGVMGPYREVDPASGRVTRLTAERAQSLGDRAWVFYQPLKAESAASSDLFRLARTGLRADFLRFLFAGFLGGLVVLLPALVVGFIADEVIPAGEVGLLYLATAALAAVGFVGAMLHVLRGMALMRLEGRAASRVEAAFWDRLLRLPPRILQRYPAGDLAMRGMTFQAIRDAMQGTVAGAVLSLVFFSPALVVIFFYDTALGAIAAAFGLLSVVTTVVLGLRQMSPQRRVSRAVNLLAGRLFQLVAGIAKLRVDGAEGSAFAMWARDYREQKQAELELGSLEAHLQAFGAALPLLAAALLFVVTTLPGREPLAVGDFLVVYALLLLFQHAVARLGTSFSAVAGIIPALRRVEPFLTESPETSAGGEPVKTLGGDLVFDHVTFRYQEGGPLILDDVSIRARPGEFVAIAGESGAGKSTLFRLALGLDQPSSGAVYYDGRDLKHLNLRQVRRKIGVVPQQVQLHPQDLWDNIAGDHEEATADDAWEAVRIAGVDREIRSMPMGMLTPVGAGGSVTSGGESQRITIAHALIRNPRILLLDEATNWLDNDSQANVMRNLADLTSTRIVIAHRLSTLREADRIYVMGAGKVVQEGSFPELVDAKGPFRDLVRRQMA